jgi:hypothetical protein
LSVRVGRIPHKGVYAGGAGKEARYFPLARV